MKNIAVILSGGSGSRFGGVLPKQFTKLAGKAVMEYTIEAFENASIIDEIVIVSKGEYIEKTWDIINRNNWKKIHKVLVGGKERFDSTLSAITALKDYPDEVNILFHDAVRPLISQKIITDCIEKLKLFDAIDVVIPSADTLVEIYDDGCISNIPNRSLMRRGQTPQGFKLGIIKKAYELAQAQNRTIFTCDCGVVRAMLPHVKVAVVEGSEKNLKITQPLDLFIAEKQLQISDRANIDHKVDFKQLKDKVIVIFGGSSGIGKSMAEIAKLNEAKVYVASRTFNKVDITDKTQISNFLNEVHSKEGKIDYVINSAGLLIKRPLETLNDQEILELVNINYLGAIYIAATSKKFLEKTNGMLLNFTSSSYTRGRAYYSIYSSANAAIVNFTQALADEWRHFNIRVNCINPERTKTPMRSKNFGVEQNELLLSAEEVAITSLATLLNNKTGIIIDIRKDGR